MTEIILYLLTGAVAGLSAGLLAVPAEHVMHMALATSLATIIITSFASARAHHRRAAVLWPVVFSLSPGIVIGAWLGAMFASMLASDVLRPVFGLFELMVALYLLVNYQPDTHGNHISSTVSFAGGTVIGSISSIVGIGGGTLTVPFLLWHNIPIRNAVASSAACGFPIAVAGTAAYIVSGWSVSGLTPYTLGFVSLPAFALIIVTSMLTAPLGASLAHKLPETTLRTVFALVLIALGVKMLWF